MILDKNVYYCVIADNAESARLLQPIFKEHGYRWSDGQYPSENTTHYYDNERYIGYHLIPPNSEMKYCTFDDIDQLKEHVRNFAWECDYLGDVIFINAEELLNPCVSINPSDIAGFL